MVGAGPELLGGQRAPALASGEGDSAHGSSAGPDRDGAGRRPAVLGRDADGQAQEIRETALLNRSPELQAETAETLY